MLKRLTDGLTRVIGPVAIIGFFLLLFEQTKLMQTRPLLVRQINLSILGLFALDVLLNRLASREGWR
ncbi:MAG: hypothetical protein MUC65_08290, partial [Pontiellaceae bacterium]|nr:hypothetical protein [Pontiellaceae bacterium]